MASALDMYTAAYQQELARAQEYARLASLAGDPNQRAMYEAARDQTNARAAQYQQMMTQTPQGSTQYGGPNGGAGGDEYTNAVNMYLAAQKQNTDRATEYERLAASTPDANAAAMYRQAAAQDRQQAQQFGQQANPNAFQEPGRTGPTSAATQQQLAEISVQEQRARADTGTASDRLAQQFRTQTMPQLQGSLGAAGQYRSTAGNNAQQQAFSGFENQNFDLQQSLQRKLDDFTRQRTYASIGLLV